MHKVCTAPPHRPLHRVFENTLKIQYSKPLTLSPKPLHLSPKINAGTVPECRWNNSDLKSWTDRRSRAALDALRPFTIHRLPRLPRTDFAPIDNVFWNFVMFTIALLKFSILVLPSFRFQFFSMHLLFLLTYIDPYLTFIAPATTPACKHGLPRLQHEGHDIIPAFQVLTACFR